MRTSRIDFEVPALSWRDKCLDLLLVVIMYALSGTLRESPQRTHRWNNKKISKKEAASLNKEIMVVSGGDPSARSRWLWSWFPQFHMPIFGGWKQYIVITPTFDQETEWHAGWTTEEGVSGVSRIKVCGPVRVLIWDKGVCFFGIGAEQRCQLPIRKIGEGTIGHGGPYRKLTLL